MRRVALPDAGSPPGIAGMVTSGRHLLRHGRQERVGIVSGISYFILQSISGYWLQSNSTDFRFRIPCKGVARGLKGRGGGGKALNGRFIQIKLNKSFAIESNEFG